MPGRESDDSLLARVGNGDRSAWGDLVERHLPPVTRYANYVLRDAAQAEDVAQESFVRLIRKAPDWQSGGASVRTWLFRVALNLCIDHKRAKRADPLDTIEDMADTGDAEIDSTIDFQRSVRTAISDLPERQQTAIILIHYEGFSGAEAAETLDISVEAVESLLARGRRTLRQSLSHIAPDLLGAK
ncbi:MAG: RNA polymerase sigma factor [Rhodospirillaceae bacterium]|nr:RNA polymerase sigma factor [Rhodospirillaceae bacterium]